MIVSEGKYSVVVGLRPQPIALRRTHHTLRAQPDAAVRVLIEKTPNVCGGAARIVRTRIPVWVIERYRQLGTSVEGLVEQFPSLREVDIAAALAYAVRHPEEIAEEIAANEAA